MSSETMNKYKLAMDTLRIAGFMVTHGQEVWQKGINLVFGKDCTTWWQWQQGHGVDVPAGSLWPYLAGWHLRLDGAWCNGKCSSLPGASQCQSALLPSPWVPVCTGLPSICAQSLAGIPIWLTGIRERVSVVALQVGWDPARASLFHHFCGPAKAILGSHQGDLMEHRDLASHVSALLVRWVSCQPPFSLLSYSIILCKLEITVQIFCPFLLNKYGIFSPLSLFTLYSFPPPIFSLFFLFSLRC